MTKSPIKTALITGGAHRIGRAIVERLAQDGWAVAIHYGRSGDEAAAQARAIQAKGGQACALHADLKSFEDTQSLIPLAREKLGPLTLLVNNASLFEIDRIETTTEASWNDHLDINLRAPFFLTQAFAAQLPEGEAGNVINLIDMRVWRLTPYFMSYTVSKCGLWTLTQTLAMALAPHIRVNGIGPGPVLQSQHQTTEQFDHQWKSTPLQRGASPQEIAAACAFILEAKAMTGQMIALDGGQHLPWPPPKNHSID